MSKRYIEIASGYRNRNNWPGPAQFVVPIDCRNRTEDPLEAHDPIDRPLLEAINRWAILRQEDLKENGRQSTSEEAP